MTMFGIQMPENAQSSVVETNMVEKTSINKEIQETRSPAVEGTSPWVSLRKIKSRDVKIIYAAAKFQWWEKVTWRKKNMVATKDINGRDNDISINETEVIFNILYMKINQG